MPSLDDCPQTTPPTPSRAAGLLRNRWLLCVGITGWLQSECPAALRRNAQSGPRASLALSAPHRHQIVALVGMNDLTVEHQANRPYSRTRRTQCKPLAGPQSGLASATRVSRCGNASEGRRHQTTSRGNLTACSGSVGRAQTRVGQNHQCDRRLQSRRIVPNIRWRRDTTRTKP
jgi:hypothetical protein